jgi:hypothetical protein
MFCQMTALIREPQGKVSDASSLMNSGQLGYDHRGGLDFESVDDIILLDQRGVIFLETEISRVLWLDHGHMVIWISFCIEFVSYFLAENAQLMIGFSTHTYRPSVI